MGEELACNAFEVRALFPLADNDGRLFGPEEWQWWRSEMSALERAFTETGIVQGFWEGQSEDHRAVFWIVPSLEDVTHIRRFVAAAKYRFRQIEMFFEYFAVRYDAV